MAADYSCDIPHTAISNLHIISIEQLVIPMGAGKMLVHERQEFVGNVSCDVLVVWWIEPYNFALALLFVTSRLLGVLDVTLVATFP